MVLVSDASLAAVAGLLLSFLSIGVSAGCRVLGFRFFDYNFLGASSLRVLLLPWLFPLLVLVLLLLRCCFGSYHIVA